jgi:5-methyltetrahydrofolate--homocysteine methyltransferase
MESGKRMTDIIELVQKGRVNEVNQLIVEGLKERVAAVELLNEGLLAAMDEVGEKWKEGKIFIPEVLIAARCLNSAMEILEPKLLDDKVESKGKVVIGTIKGDLHDIGKNLVALMLKSKGFEIVDLGTDVDSDRFVQAVIEVGADIVCMSSLLTTSMPNFSTTIAALKEAGIKDKVCIAIGGAPITQAFADEIGADVYAPDAVTAAEALVAWR